MSTSSTDSGTFPAGRHLGQSGRQLGPRRELPEEFADARLLVTATRSANTVVFIATKLANGGFRSKPFVADTQGIEAALRYASKRSARGEDVYVAVAAFREPYRTVSDDRPAVAADARPASPAPASNSPDLTSGAEELLRSLGAVSQPPEARRIGDRTTANMLSVGALIADIDVKPSAYATYEEAREALAAVCAALALPPPVFVVNSGGGVHAWWPLSVPLELGAWRSLATAFSAALRAAGLRFDPGPTANPVGVLRLPSTANFKYHPPRPVRLVEVNPDPLSAPPGALHYDPSRLLVTLTTALGHLGVSLPSAPVRSDAMSSVAMPLAAQEPVGFFCLQACKSLAEGGAHDPEPLWRGLLSIARQCREGLALAHRLSRLHPGYSELDTEAKFERAEVPYTCARFEELRPEPCLACPNRGLISSPLQLDHNRRAPATPEQESAYKKLRNVFLAPLAVHGVRVALGHCVIAWRQMEPDLVRAVLPRVVWLAAHNGADEALLATVAADRVDGATAGELARKALTAVARHARAREQALRKGVAR